MYQKYHFFMIGTHKGANSEISPLVVSNNDLTTGLVDALRLLVLFDYGTKLTLPGTSSSNVKNRNIVTNDC